MRLCAEKLIVVLEDAEDRDLSGVLGFVVFGELLHVLDCFEVLELNGLRLREPLALRECRKDHVSELDETIWDLVRKGE